MSKETEKVPIPEDNVERFMTLLWSMVGPCGIDQFPDILHYVEMLSQSIDRYSFEKTHSMSPQKKVHEERKKFIRIFKQRYVMAYDLEYGHKLTGIEGKLINQANKQLKDSGFDCDEYLRWVFDDYLVENPKFAPANMKQMCSTFFLHKFIVEHRGLKEERGVAEKEKKDVMALIGKGRELMRNAKENGDSVTEEKVRQVLKDFKEKRIMLSELRRAINEGIK